MDYSGRWREVNRREPCPICGVHKWCRVSADGVWAVCRRAGDGGQHRIDQSGVDYWLYRLNEAARPSTIAPITDSDRPQRADADTLDAVYSAMLDRLDLSHAHLEALRGRGLPDTEIDLRGYRSLPLQGRARLARDLVDRFGRHACGRVPGLYLKRNGGRSWWTLAGPLGLVVPVRDIRTRIVALKVRVDDPGDGPRYLYVSTTAHAGPGPGNPAHVPLFTGDADVIRLTEGELKADVATVLSGIVTIAIPGVAAWRAALPVIAALRPRAVRLAIDADHRRNPHVARALRDAFQTLALGRTAS